MCVTVSVDILIPGLKKMYVHIVRRVLKSVNMFTKLGVIYKICDNVHKGMGDLKDM